MIPSLVRSLFNFLRHDQIAPIYMWSKGGRLAVEGRTSALFFVCYGSLPCKAIASSLAH